MSAPAVAQQRPKDPLFDVSRPELLAIWDRLQRLQVNIVFLQELSAYYTSPSWHASREVLDLGAGNGYYLKRLAERFPDKTYLGVDLAPQLVDIAQREAAGSRVRFQCADMFDTGGDYDFVVMRLLLQHLSSIDVALDKVARVTRPGGSALVVDSLDPARYFHPPLPEFMQFFGSYTEQQASQGLDRRAAQIVAERVSHHPEWRLGASWQIVVPSTLPGNLETFKAIYSGIIDLLEHVGQVCSDYVGLRRAWQAWCTRPDAYTQVGVSIVRLERV